MLLQGLAVVPSLKVRRVDCNVIQTSTHLPLQQWLDEDDKLHEENLREKIEHSLTDIYRDKEAKAGADQMRYIEKAVMLQTLDSQWKEHLASMDYLRQGIHLRGFAQKNPKQEYKREACRVK